MLYLDMDGVLMDFEGAIQAHGVTRYRDGLHWITRPRAEWPEEMVVADKAYIQCMAKPDFWSSVKPMPDAHALWNFCRPLRPHILTAVPSDRPGEAIFGMLRERIAHQKRGSIWQCFDTTFPGGSINVCERHEKRTYAKPGAVLVDDTPGNCKEWEAAGGTAVLHTDAISTIRILQEIYHGH